MTLHKLTEKETHKNRTIKNPSEDQINTHTLTQIHIHMYMCVNIVRVFLEAKINSIFAKQ